jgi:hypothetical protein
MRSLLLAATALIMLGNGSYAQTSNAGSDSRSTAINSSGSQSSSVSNPRVNVIGNPIGNGASSSNSGARASASTRSASRSAAIGNTTNVTVGYTGTEGGGSATDPSGTTRGEQYIGYGGSYTVHNTPEVIPPNVVGGNACAVGASGGMSVAGFGVAGGATWADKACERRQQAALLYNMGEQKIALELMCQDDNIRSAMRVGGKPCTADIAGATSAVPPTQVAAVAATPAVVATPVAATQPKPAWCAKAAPTTEASKAYVAQVCGN